MIKVAQNYMNQAIKAIKSWDRYNKGTSQNNFVSGVPRTFQHALWVGPNYKSDNFQAFGAAPNSFNSLAQYQDAVNMQGRGTPVKGNAQKIAAYRKYWFPRWQKQFVDAHTRQNGTKFAFKVKDPQGVWRNADPSNPEQLRYVDENGQWANAAPGTTGKWSVAKGSDIDYTTYANGGTGKPYSQSLGDQRTSLGKWVQPFQSGKVRGDDYLTGDFQYNYTDEQGNQHRQMYPQQTIWHVPVHESQLTDENRYNRYKQNKERFYTAALLSIPVRWARDVAACGKFLHQYAADVHLNPKAEVIDPEGYAEAAAKLKEGNPIYNKLFSGSAHILNNMQKQYPGVIPAGGIAQLLLGIAGKLPAAAKYMTTKVPQAVSTTANNIKRVRQLNKRLKPLSSDKVKHIRSAAKAWFKGSMPQLAEQAKGLWSKLKGGAQAVGSLFADEGAALGANAMPIVRNWAYGNSNIPLTPQQQKYLDIHNMTSAIKMFPQTSAMMSKLLGITSPAMKATVATLGSIPLVQRHMMNIQNEAGNKQYYQQQGQLASPEAPAPSDRAPIKPLSDDVIRNLGHKQSNTSIPRQIKNNLTQSGIYGDNGVASNSMQLGAMLLGRVPYLRVLSPIAALSGPVAYNMKANRYARLNPHEAAIRSMPYQNIVNTDALLNKRNLAFNYNNAMSNWIRNMTQTYVNRINGQQQ